MSGPRQQMGKALPGIDVALESNHVFIDLNDTVAALMPIVDDLEKGTITFVRAPVATGKSTLCKYICGAYPNKFVEIDPGYNEQNFHDRLVEVCNLKLFDGAVSITTSQGAVQAFNKAGRVLVIDEAHQLFNYATALAVLTGKIGSGNDSLGLKILMFSAGATGVVGGDLVATPKEILKKVMWYPPTPNAEELVPQLRQAGVHLDKMSVAFFLKLCNIHRGVFMRAMAWVKQQQQEQQQEQQQQPMQAADAGAVSWGIHQSVSQVHFSLSESASAELAQAGSGWDCGIRKFMKESRAVRVNSQYSDLGNIPKPFLDVLYGGSQTKANLSDMERTLSIAGFLAPERNIDSIDQEFVDYDWNDVNKSYSIANTLMAQFYRDIFKGEGFDTLILPVKPTSGADLLARVLPYMSFSAVIDTPTQMGGELITSLSSFDLPPEPHYNRALFHGLQKLGFLVSQPEAGNSGKPDVVVTLENRTFAIETIMAKREVKAHTGHAKRFAMKDQPNYSKASVKTLLTIGSDKEDLLEKARTVRPGNDVEVVACLVSQAHDSYEMYVRKPGEDVVSGPIFLYCDMVAKALSSSCSEPKSVQRKRKIGEVSVE